MLNTSSLVCSNHYNSMISLFYYLKYIEWSDTIFLVIKKKNISFLHYFHHMIVPIFVYANYAFVNTAGQSYVMLSNSLAHGLMYIYYAYPNSQSDNLHPLIMPFIIDLSFFKFIFSIEM